MSDTLNNNKAAPISERPPRGRRLLIGLAILVALLVAGGFIATTSPVLKALVLPRLSAALGAKVTAGSIRLSPWSQLAIQELSVHTTGAEPLLRVKEARVNYRLPELLGGGIRIRQVDLVGPAIVWTQNADGTSNLDPLFKAMEPKPGAPEKPPVAEPLRIAIDQARVSQANLRMLRYQKDSSRQTVTVDNLDFSLEQLANRQSGKASLNASLRAENLAGAATLTSSSGTVAADLRSEFAFSLNNALWPEALQGRVDVDVTQAVGAWRAAQGLSMTWDCDATTNLIRRATLAFKQGAEDLARLSVAGSYDLDKREADVRAELGGIDRRLLNVLGAARGWDLGRSVLSGTHAVKITEGGNRVAVTGELLARQVSVKQTNFASPELDMTGAFQVSVDWGNQKLQVERLSFLARQQERDLVRAALDRPMILVWNTNATTLPDSAFELVVTNLNLADWQALSDGKVRAGSATANMRLQSQQAGQKLGFDLSANLTGLSTRMGTQLMDGLAIRLKTAGQLANLAQLRLDALQFEVAQQNRRLTELEGAGSVDFAQTNLQAQVNLTTSLSEMLSWIPVPDLRLSSGQLQFNGRISQTNQIQNFNGRISLASLTGAYTTNYQFQGFQAAGDLDMEMRGQRIEVRNSGLSLGDSGRDGRLDLSGHWDLDKAGGQLAFKGQKLTQGALNPFLKPWIAPRVLEAVILDATGTAVGDSQGIASLKADFQAANLKLSDPQHRIPVMPLDLRGSIDAVLPFTMNFQFKNLEIQTQSQGQPAGALRLNASLDLGNSTGQVAYQVTHVNQNLLAPWLNPFLTPQTLASIQIHSAGSARWGSNSQITATCQITNLVLQGETATARTSPLSLDLRLDGSLAGQQMDLRELSLALGPTARASNRLDIRGRFGSGAGGQESPRVTLQSEALDLTPWYDAWETLNPTPQASAAVPPKAKAGVEPDAIHLPVTDAVVELKLDRVYLRDLAISNWVATARVRGDEISLNPCQLVMNGVPVHSTLLLNLGTPGYTYDFVLKGDRLPLRPFMSVIKPELAAETQGDLSLNVQVKGAGTTGANLRKTLAGHADFTVTNAQIRLAPKSNRLLEPVAALLRLDELVKAQILGLQARLQMGSGEVLLQPLQVDGDAFQASMKGGIPIADMIENSPLDLPVEFALERGLAGKSGLLPANTPTNQAFVSLPAFARVRGTLGKPETRADKMVIAGLIARSAINLPGIRGHGATNTLGKISDLLLGPAPAAASPSATPAADGKTSETTPTEAPPAEDAEGTTDPSATPSSDSESPVTPSSRFSLPGSARTNVVRPLTVPSTTVRPSASTNQPGPARRSPFLRGAPANPPRSPAPSSPSKNNQ